MEVLTRFPIYVILNYKAFVSKWAFTQTCAHFQLFGEWLPTSLKQPSWHKLRSLDETFIHRQNGLWKLNHQKRALLWMFSAIHLWRRLVLEFCLLGGFWLFQFYISSPVSLGRLYVFRNVYISPRLSSLLVHKCL